jgi:hypothetical protein
MGFDVHIQIAWEGGKIEEVKPVAEEFLKQYLTQGEDNTSDEIIQFLNDVISGKSCFEGRKGWLWLWGLIGNYTHGEEILIELMPFFKTLFDKKILLDFYRIILFEEPEQTESVNIYELDNTGKIKKYSSEGKWCWMQY